MIQYVFLSIRSRGPMPSVGHDIIFEYCAPACYINRFIPKTPFNRFGNKSFNIRRDAHSEPNAYLNLTQLFPSVLLPRFVACRSRVRCLQSALREVTLFVMYTITSFTTDIVSTMCRMWQHCLSTLRAETTHNEARCKNILKQLRNTNHNNYKLLLIREINYPYPYVSS